VVVILCGALAITGGWSIWLRSDDDSASGGSSKAGEKIGQAQIQALPAADDDEQDRTAAVIEAATKMANAFLNLDYKNVDASTEAVISLATGPFKSQYEKSAKDLALVASRAKSVQKGEVVWAGVVAADKDSATVIVASSGSVANKTTKFKAVPRNYRLQLDLANEDGAWLTNDLQFVSLD
jgi:Mce-associated membrane protein